MPLVEILEEHVLVLVIGVSISTDQDWHGWVTLVIAPNPGLSPSQKKVIERDSDMRGGTADLKVRKALAYHTKHRLGLDLDPKARRSEDQHVVLVTRSDK
jgi:hypothetical protein